MRMSELAAGPGWRVRELVCRAGPGDRAVEERHEMVTVAAVLAGSFRYRSTEGAALLAPGALLLGNAGACFTCGHEHARGDRCIAFQFTPARFAAIAAGVPGLRRARFAAHAIPPIAATARLLAAAMRAGGDALAWEELSLRFAGASLGLAAAGSRGGGVTAQDERRVTAALRLVEARCAEPLTLDALAAAARLSPYHFLRVFRRTVGTTPHQFVLRTRLRRAAARITGGGTSITEAAYASGFGDLSTFNAQFRREFGAAPSAWLRSSGRGSA
jgi:AraC family transcriptional regulator